jgi:protein-tyrosine phosphatase
MQSIEIPLERASNLRDLGGWPTTDGRRVRCGLVFRGPALLALSQADEDVLASLGIRTVCDLRGVHERERHPLRIGTAATHALAIEPSVGAGLNDILRTGRASGHFGPVDMMALLREAYCDYALRNHPQYRLLFEHVLAEDGLPLLLHCSAGKDRTGFGAALLLTALGVAWDNVMADYMATNRLWKREIARELSLPDALKDVLLGVHEELLVAAFAAIHAEYGSVNAYLTGPIGLDTAARAQLAERLLE